ncbi:MAG: GNAT family N-acetyltransferase [Romboutsia sp.]
MNKVIYRDLIRDDYKRIEELICEAFGFDDFIKDKKVLNSILTVYLQGCILDSSFSKVAVKDNKVIGIILGKSNNDKTHLRKMPNIISSISALPNLIFSSKENKRLVKEFSKVKDAYTEIIKGKEDSFDGCIQLFIVSEESRGLGVGKTLMSNLFDYMKSTHVYSIYLYTDTRCNYGFYDSQNFKRINEKEIYFDNINASLNVFLYSYNF